MKWETAIYPGSTPCLHYHLPHVYTTIYPMSTLPSTPCLLYHLHYHLPHVYSTIYHLPYHNPPPNQAPHLTQGLHHHLSPSTPGFPRDVHLIIGSIKSISICTACPQPSLVCYFCGFGERANRIMCWYFYEFNNFMSISFLDNFSNNILFKFITRINENNII
jgi:hypothetical protein